MRKPCSAPLAMIVVLAMMLIACTSSQHRAVLDSADSLMNARPDSALTLLNALLPDTDQMRKGDLMRFHLLRTNAENKCDTVLTARHAALMRRVCDYYDHKASSPWGDERGASRMLAHYLLGRCYDDMGEAPKALESFCKAIEYCDTNSNDCNHSLLSIVYYQKAKLLLYQLVLPDAIDCYEKARQSALLSGDSLWAIGYLEHKASAYYMMHQYDSVLSVCKEASQEYVRHGYIAQSYNSFPLVADVLLERGQTDSVGRMLSEYEANSGLFDELGEIQQGRELYYYYKGKYLTASGKYDAARSLFTKLLSKSQDPNHVEAATKGLFELYSILNIADSVTKYGKMYCNANDSSYSRIYTEETVKAKSMYDYSRSERQVHEKTIEVEKARNSIYILFVVLTVIVCLLILIVTLGKKRIKEQKLHTVLLNSNYNTLLSQFNGLQAERDALEKENELHRLEQANAITIMEEKLKVLQSQNRSDEDEYRELAEKYRLSQRELQLTKQRQAKYVETYAKRIDELTMQLSEFTESGDSKHERWNAEDALLHFEIVSSFHNLSSAGRLPVESQWTELKETVSKKLNSFYQAITSDTVGLNETEIRTAILIRLQFIVSECCILLDKKNQNMTNIRANINRKLFNSKGTKGLKTRIMEL